MGTTLAAALVAWFPGLSVPGSVATWLCGFLALESIARRRLSAAWLPAVLLGLSIGSLALLANVGTLVCHRLEPLIAKARPADADGSRVSAPDSSARELAPRTVDPHARFHAGCRQVAIALLQYRDENRTFPPWCQRDSSGRPLVSWRVLLLPHLDRLAVYEKYDPTRPWNEPPNAGWLAEVPEPFRHAASRAPLEETSLVAITGPGTAWPDDRLPRDRDFRDGTSMTILLVESAASGIAWTEPRDVPLDDLLAAIRDRRPLPIGGHDPRGIVCVFADASLRRLPAEVFADAELVRALVTIAGGEPVVNPPGELVR